MNGKEIMQIAHQTAGLAYLAQDSAVVLDAGDIRKIVAGLEIGTAELLIAADLGADMVIAHHPTFAPGSLLRYQTLEGLMDRMVALGVFPSRVCKIIRKIQDRIRRGRAGNSGNYDRAPSIARLLEMPLMNIHEPALILGERMIQSAIDEHLIGVSEPLVADGMHALLSLPECQRTISPPAVYVGERSSYAGRIAALMSPEAAEFPEIAAALFEAGVGTLVLPYAQEAVIAAVKEQNIGNLVVMGHVTADSIGMNAILDHLECRGAQIVRVSGIIETRGEA